MMVLVDDSPDQLELMLLALRPLGLGAAVVTFRSGEDCVSAVECGAVAPRLVLIDVNMPGLDGAATTARLRALFGRRAAIVLMSTSDLAEDVQRGIEAGADSYVMKPSANRSWTDMLADVTGYWLGSDLRARL
jgi:CheY-like chemotaxis protein